MFQLQDKINGFLVQLSNYSISTMDQDLQRLQTAKSLVNEVISSLSSSTPSMIQMSGHAQLQETVALMSKLRTLNLIKGDSMENIKSKITSMLTSTSVASQSTQANELLTSINGIIDEVSSVRHELFSVHEVNSLEMKRKTVSALIESSCATGTGSVIVKNVTQNDFQDADASSRAFVSDNAEPFFLELTGAISPNLTAVNLTEYVLAGWVRWLDFVDGTWDHSHTKDPAVIARLFSIKRKDLGDDQYYEDKHVYITADQTTYSFCLHDTTLGTLDNCQLIDVSSYVRETQWDFVEVMYSYKTGSAVARVKVGGTHWISVHWSKAVTQVPFTGYLGLFVGGDDFYTERTSFNGEIGNWKILFGTNTFWASQPGAQDDSKADVIVPLVGDYTPVPALSKSVDVNQDAEVALTSNSYSRYNFINTFLDASGYGFGVWVKVNTPGQIATLSFETRTDIETPGNAIAQVYAENGAVFVSVQYEKNRDYTSQVKQVASLISDFFLIQVEFTTKGAQVFIEQNGVVTTTSFTGFDQSYIPQNVYLTIGACDILGKAGADMSYKTTTVYAGTEVLYGKTCDKSCRTCSGPAATDCSSCFDGSYIDDGVCNKCDDSCATCDGCGKDHCTACPVGTVLANGECYCDPACVTCDGISDSNCLSCKDNQVLLGGRCKNCDGTCLTCSDTTSSGCLSCQEGYKVESGQCVPNCDASCKSCTVDGTCTSCHSPLVLFNGQCIACDASCNTCSGPEAYQCLDCVAPAQFSCGKCIVCDSNCLTCDGTTKQDCLSCEADKVLVDKQCLVPCDEKNGFVRVGDACLPCDKSCLTCSGTGSDKCTSCDDSLVLSKGYCVPPNPQPCDTTNGWVLINNQCIQCDINNGHGLINDRCITCDTTCKTCYGTADNNCLSCYDPDVLSNGKCGPEEPTCDPKKGEVLYNGQCVLCDTSCLTCSGITDHDCTSCVEGEELTKDGTCVPIVPPCDTENGYFVDSNGNCVPCDASCLTCDGPNDSDCTSCVAPNVVNKDSGKCEPPCDTNNGFVLINGVCYPCDSTCATCSGKTDTDCETCVSGLILSNGQCLPPCDTDNGFVLINKQCLPCSDTCKTCKDVSNFDCTSCFDPLILQAGACIEKPIDCAIENGFVMVNGVCLPCDKSCLTCSDITDTSCLTCPDGFLLQGGQCVNPPPTCDTANGKVYINGQCFDCDITCKTCSGVGAGDCTECADGLVSIGGFCVPFCDVDNGFFRQNGNCLPCDKSCLTCDGSLDTNCVTCVDSDFLEAGRCLPIECVNKDDMVSENKDGSCSSDCDCDGTRRCNVQSGQCEDCNVLHEENPSFYYTDLCTPCDSSCLECRGPSNSECTKCETGEFLLNGQCFPCDSSCLECSGPSSVECTDCNKDDILVDGVCKVPCDTNNGFFYVSDRDCEPCGKNCQTCHGSADTDCDTCQSGFELKADGECKVPCDTDKGYFYDLSGNCSPCDESCLTCDGPNNDDCTECNTGFFLEFGKCLPTKCVDYDYVFDESIIAECNSDCECDGTRRCNPNGECEDCNQLVIEFPDQYTNVVCPPCQPECHTCRGPNSNDCTTCQPGYYFDNGNCLPCDKSCLTCSGPSNDQCVTCDNLHVLRAGQCVVPCEESNGYFYDKDDNCVPCDTTCKTCFDTTKESCLSCYGDDTLDSNICWPPCDTKGGETYDANHECVPCDKSCLTCSGPSDNQCIDCNTGFSIVDGRCVSCVSFYYSYDESSNPNGPSHCSSDCECDNTRRCGPNGVCLDCDYLAQYFPTLYAASDCPSCDTTCLTCKGPSYTDCTACVDGEYLGTDGACHPCDDSCVACDGPTSKDCTECDKDEILSNGECIVPPPDCDKTCLTCDGPTDHDCTSCSDVDELTADGQCVPKDCVNWSYDYNEANSPLGAGRCDDDCECDGSRRCSPSGYCQECLDLVIAYPNIYDLKDCPSCDPTCNTCNGGSASECTSCLSGFYLTASGTCAPCDTSCATCDNSGPQSCTSCPPGKELNDNKECVVPCDPTCLTCSGPAIDECDSCTIDKTLVDGKCIVTPVCVKLDYTHDESTNALGPNRCINDCDCDSSRRCSPDGFCRECMYLSNLYPSIYDAKDCPPCDASCLTCQGPANTDCTSCQDGFVLVDGECLPCDKSCLTCSDVSDSSCTSCESPLILSNGQCINPPPVCDSTCVECSGPNPWECTVCPDNESLVNGYCVPINCVSWDYVKDEVDGRCNSDCDCNGARRCSPDKYCQECDALALEFPALYPPSECPVCDSTCVTCSGPKATDCTSCASGYVLVDGQCEPCDSSCATCDGLTDDDCTSCFTPYILQTTASGAKCVPPPPVCDPTCLTCSGTTDKDCISCPEGYQLAFDGSCQPIETCVKWGFSHDESSNVLGAGRCVDDCDCDGTRRCSPTGYCLSCEDLANTYPDIYSLKDCPVCDGSCLTCNGPSSSDCTACNDGFFLVNGVCEPCAVPHCLYCVGDVNSCGKCEDGFLLNDVLGCSVPPVVCDKTCLECSGPNADECTKCAEDAELVNGSCVPINCVAFDYKFDEASSPLGPGRCNDDCECDGTRRCSPDKYCAECVDLVYEYPTVYSFSDCPICDKSCLSCDGPSDKDCTSCEDGFVLVDGSCEPCDSSCANCKDITSTGCISCPKGYDLQADGSCKIHIDCDPTCLECDGPADDQCSKCDTGRILVGGKCILECVRFDYMFKEDPSGACTTDCDCDGTRRCGPTGVCDECQTLDGLFPALFSPKDCPPCDATCATCFGSNPDNCKTCFDGFYLASDTTCQPCDKSCKTCDSGDVNGCTSCYDPNVLQNGYCQEPNPVCDPTCVTCTGPNPTDCVTCPDHYELAADGECLPINCVSWDYYVNELLNKEGPYACTDDCECDGTRRCGPDGFCHECVDLVAQFPTVYFESDCPVCDKTCLTCKGASDHDCTSCVDGEVLVGGQCLPCDSSCLTCSGVASNNCVTCVSPFQLNSDNECVKPFPICDPTCLTCTGPNNNDCTSCFLGFSLSNGECKNTTECDDWNYSTNENADSSCSNDCDCSGTRRCSPDGFCHECVTLAAEYPDLYTDCPPCNNVCLTCDGPTDQDCIVCVDGYYLDKDGCLPCDSTCLTCSGGSTGDCITCTPDRVLQNGFCVIPDPKCDPTCLTCKGPLPTDCTSCPDNFKLSDQGTCDAINCVAFDYNFDESLNLDGCKDDCDCNSTRRCGPSGYCDSCLDLASLYPSSYPPKDCPICDDTCDDCNGPSPYDCIKCPEGLELFNGQCIDCDSSCLTCFGTGFDNCLTCDNDKVLWEHQCITPDPTCDPTCVTCFGPNSNECTACPCDRELINGECIFKTISCDASCLTCIGPYPNQCSSCPAGSFLHGGACLALNSFVGFRKSEETPLKYEVAKKVSERSDIAVGTWSKYVPSLIQNGVLFRLSGLTSTDKQMNTNDYRFSTLAVYYNETHYTFETYSKASGSPVLLQKSIAVSEMKNTWNLIFFGYSRSNNKATGYVVSPDGAQQSVEFNNVVQDKPEENMNVYFFGDEVNNGFSGEVSSPEVLHGTNFMQTFNMNNKNTYFPFKGRQE